ncbi:MAG: hypothetical protein AAFO15_02470 [Pseudomonadota bacterium]
MELPPIQNQFNKDQQPLTFLTTFTQDKTLPEQKTIDSNNLLVKAYNNDIQFDHFSQITPSCDPLNRKLNTNGPFHQKTPDIIFNSQTPHTSITSNKQSINETSDQKIPLDVSNSTNYNWEFTTTKDNFSIKLLFTINNNNYKLQQTIFNHNTLPNSNTILYQAHWTQKTNNDRTFLGIYEQPKISQDELNDAINLPIIIQTTKQETQVSNTTRTDSTYALHVSDAKTKSDSDYNLTTDQPIEKIKCELFNHHNKISEEDFTLTSKEDLFANDIQKENAVNNSNSESI